jgi:hypothetical protein
MPVITWDEKKRLANIKYEARYYVAETKKFQGQV